MLARPEPMIAAASDVLRQISNEALNAGQGIRRIRKLFNDATVRGSVIAGIEAYHAGMVLDDAIPVVWSRVGAGQKSAIISAGVGSIPDTQRRRRNELEEQYLDVSLG